MNRNALRLSILLFCVATGRSAADEQPGPFDEFAKTAHIVVGPRDETHEQYLLQGWNEPTVVDLRGSRFLANENGPFAVGKLPPAWPDPAALKALPEASLEEKYPVSLRGGPAPIYVRGGSVIGIQPRELPWRIVKGRYDGDAVRIQSAGPMVVDGLYSENVEDTFSPRGGGRWTIRNCYARYLRDDFVENDGLQSGEVDDCLVEGCHVFISARPGKRAAPKALAEKKANPPHVVVRRTVVHVPALPYDGDMKQADRETIVDGKAGGKLFKWSPAGGTLDVSDSVFRVDVISPSGSNSMHFPAGTYRNVTLVWLGGGDYPAPIPPGVTVTDDVSLWERARKAWFDRHPEFKPLDGPTPPARTSPNTN
jgi:hypothetical protein